MSDFPFLLNIVLVRYIQMTNQLCFGKGFVKQLSEFMLLFMLISTYTKS